MKECNGKIHSIESMALVDGPGIRVAVFFQGCNLRCIYCHNPDTWDCKEGYEISSKELLKKIVRYKPYFNKSNGGVTFSGGECLIQKDFLLQILKLCKKEGIHTAIDTSGYGTGNYDEILKYVDLVILDIKHIDDNGYRNITGHGIKGLNDFIEALNKANKKVWIRHVVIPGLTDTKEHIIKLEKIIKKIDNVENIELLPYHTLGKYKYEKLNIKYKLNHIGNMDKDKLYELEKVLKKDE